MPISSFLGSAPPFSVVPEIFVIFPCIFLRKIIFHFLPRKKIFWEKEIPSFLMVQEITFRCDFFRKAIFPEHLKKISYFHVFFWERSPFIFHLKNKIIFSGKRNIIFSDDARNIMLRCNFFRKTIFSEYVEKNVLILAVENSPIQPCILKPKGFILSCSSKCHTKLRPSARYLLWCNLLRILSL